MSNTRLLNQIREYENQLKILLIKLEELKKKEKKFVEITKEEINKQKTLKQIEIENKSPLFLKNKIPDNKLFHPYRSGCKNKEKLYTNMFEYTWINREDRKEGKVKFINECLNINNYINLKKSKNENVNDKVKNENVNDKVYISLQNKKINELKIVARDLKIKGYSIMCKEELVKKIFEIVKQKNKNIELKSEEIYKNDEPENETEDIDNDLDENEYNDDDINESEEVDYN